MWNWHWREPDHYVVTPKWTLTLSVKLVLRAENLKYFRGTTIFHRPADIFALFLDSLANFWTRNHCRTVHLLRYVNDLNFPRQVWIKLLLFLLFFSGLSGARKTETEKSKLSLAPPTCTSLLVAFSVFAKQNRKCFKSAEISTLPPFCPPAESQWRFSVPTTFFQAEKTSQTAKWRRDFKLRNWWFWWRFETIFERTTLRDNSLKSGASRWRQVCQLQSTNPRGRASQKWSKNLGLHHPRWVRFWEILRWDLCFSIVDYVIAGMVSRSLSDGLKLLRVC